MMSDDAAEALATQVRLLGEQMKSLSEQVGQVREEIHAQPRWPHALLEWRRPPSAHASLVSVLRYHEQASRRTAAIYYLIIAALFAIFALSVLLGSSYVATLPAWLRVVAGIGYLLVGAGQISCIVLPTLRYQLVMSLPTVFCTAMIGVINDMAATAHHSGAVGVVNFIFWCAIAGIHVGFAANTRGRLEQRDLTRDLIARLEERAAAGEEP